MHPYLKKELMKTMQQSIQQVVPYHPCPFEDNFSSYVPVYHTKNTHLSQTCMCLGDFSRIVYKVVEEVLIGSQFHVLGTPLFVSFDFHLFAQTDRP